MKLTLERAHREFDRFNALYFGNALPIPEMEIVADLRFDGEQRNRLWGATSKDADGFKLQLLAGMPADLWLLKLCHEMAHMKIWPKSHRSKEWRDEIKRLAALGFLAEVF